MKRFSLAHIIAAALGLLIVLLAATFSLRAQDVVTDPAFIIKNGSKLNFDYNKGEEKFDLTMTIDAVTPDIVYDWTATGRRIRKGHVTYIHKEAETGRSLSSDLTDGDDRSNAPTLLFSQVQLRELRLGKTIYYKDGVQKTQGIVVVAKEKMNVTVNGTTKALDVIHAKTVMTGSSDEFWVLNNENYPLVLKATINNTHFEIKTITL